MVADSTFITGPEEDRPAHTDPLQGEEEGLKLPSSLLPQKNIMNVYRVEDEVIPLHDAFEDLDGPGIEAVRRKMSPPTGPVEPLPTDGSEDVIFRPLPKNIPLEKVLTNILNNLDFDGWSVRTKIQWFKDFSSISSKAVISDCFWYCICFYFKAGRLPEVETRLFDRIASNYVCLFSLIPAKRKDFFFTRYYDAVAQAVLYSLFLAYPKSRVHFTEAFRKDILIRFSFWTTGIKHEFVEISHWKLNLGGGDVLQSIKAQTETGEEQKENGQGGAVNSSSAPGGATGEAPKEKEKALMVLPSAPDAAVRSIMGSEGRYSKQKDTSLNTGRIKRSLVKRPPRPIKNMRYSPLVSHFLRLKKYSSANLVQSLFVRMTEAEERQNFLDEKHHMLLHTAEESKRATLTRIEESEAEFKSLRRDEKAKATLVKQAKKRLDVRKKEVLRADVHEYANYLVALNQLQEQSLAHS